MNEPRLPAVDESLMERRRIVKASPDADSGWEIELSCGHTIWCAVRPHNTSYCGECLVEMVDQARALRAAQTKPVKS